jgi:GntR family histidine utilization transcriptional repressor
MKERTKSNALPHSAAPLYEKVKTYVLQRIESGEWSLENRLPGEPDLSRELGVSRMTVNRALRELAAEEIIERIPGVGTFVAPRKPLTDDVKIHNIADEIRGRNQAYRCEVFELSRANPPPDVAAGMYLAPSAEVYCAKLVHHSNNLPIQLEERYVLPRFAPAFAEQDFTQMTTTEYLYSIMPPSAAEHVIGARMPDGETARLLQMGIDEPCLVVTRRTWVDDEITSHMCLQHPGSRFQLVGQASTVLRR